MILKITAYSLDCIMGRKKPISEAAQPKRSPVYPFISPDHERGFKKCLALVKCRAKVCRDETGERYLATRPQNFVELFTAMDNHGLANDTELRAFAVGKQNDFSDRGYFEFKRERFNKK